MSATAIPVPAAARNAVIGPPSTSAIQAVSHSPLSAAARPAGATIRPVRRCHRGRGPRLPGANWTAPSTANTVTLTMCTASGTGVAAECGGSRTAGPPESSTRRTAPAATGTRASSTSAVGTGHCRRAVLGICVVMPKIVAAAELLVIAGKAGSGTVLSVEGAPYRRGGTRCVS